MLNSTTGFAVGDTLCMCGHAYDDAHLLMEQLINGQWQIIQSPPTTDPQSRLSAVTMISQTQAFAVGFIVDPSVNYEQALIEQWDGSTWSKIPLPITNTYDDLTSIKAFAPNNIWAVGRSYSRSSNAASALIEHFNGTSWNTLPNPSSWQGFFPRVIDGTANNMWVFGYGPTYYNLLHFNGISWKQVSIPNQAGELFSLAAVGNTAILVGHTVINNEYYSLIETCTTTACTNASIGADPSVLYGITAPAANDIWAVGEGNTPQAFIEHFDGTRWSIVPTPTSNEYQLTSVSAASDGSLVAVGGIGNTLVEQYS